MYISSAPKIKSGLLANLTRDNYDREINGLQEAISKYNLPEGLLLVYYSEIEPKEIPQNIELVPIWKWLVASGNNHP
ncbi:MAG TPA: hypothetical protein ENI76_08120 [Ignavibacteria bacterium]|nr:hypothetical protein [Ignavibacteria bacterium]